MAGRYRSREQKEYEDHRPHHCKMRRKGQKPVITLRKGSVRMGLFYDYYVKFCPRCGEDLLKKINDDGNTTRYPIFLTSDTSDVSIDTLKTKLKMMGQVFMANKISLQDIGTDESYDADMEELK